MSSSPSGPMFNRTIRLQLTYMDVDNLNIITMYNYIIGLSFIERPILGDHPKAHNFEIQQISRNPVDFTVDFTKSSRFHMKNLINQMFQQLFSLGVQGRGAMTQDFMKSWVIAPLPAFIKLNISC